MFLTTSVLWQMVNLGKSKRLAPALGVGVSPEIGPHTLEIPGISPLVKHVLSSALSEF